MFFLCGGILAITQFGQFDLMLVQSLYRVKVKPGQEKGMGVSEDQRPPDDGDDDDNESKFNMRFKKQSTLHGSTVPIQNVSFLRLCMRARCNCFLKLCCIGKPNRAE